MQSIGQKICQLRGDDMWPYKMALSTQVRSGGEQLIGGVPNEIEQSGEVWIIKWQLAEDEDP